MQLRSLAVISNFMAKIVTVNCELKLYYNFKVTIVSLDFDLCSFYACYALLTQLKPIDKSFYKTSQISNHLSVYLKQMVLKVSFRFILLKMKKKTLTVVC